MKKVKATCLWLLGGVFVLLVIFSCSGKNESMAYKAEQRLFKARKMKNELVGSRFNEDFFERTKREYQRLINDFSNSRSDSREIDGIVVSAQMDLAELDYRAGLLDSSIIEFKKAAAIADNFPDARGNALYSIAAISEEMQKKNEAINYYEQFYNEFLKEIDLSRAPSMNSSYFTAPLKLAQLTRDAGDMAGSAQWLKKAENLYNKILSSASDTTLLKATRLNLLTAYLEGKRWDRALQWAEDIEKEAGPEEAPAIEFIIARIYRDGKGDKSLAYERFMKIYKKFPESNEAPLALLAAAGIDRARGKTEEATKLYEKVLKEYPTNSPAAIEAEWNIAEIDESQNKWVEASLRYKSIYSNYPTSLEGFEAPIRIMKNYLKKGEKDAAAAAYKQAVEHYKKMEKQELPIEPRILAAEYLVRAMVEFGDWQKAVETLVSLPDIYPQYENFKANYLYAASICETELKDRGRAEKILTRCIEKYPGSEVAKEAKKQLDRLRSIR
ncbi:hypothetical protein DRQ05_01905 [bacterium]|nr:MAG: hypothetical protein DRQ05_01905 [bacterium]